jgi:hypothetical protein
MAQRFVFLSDSTIPIKPLGMVIRYLLLHRASADGDGGGNAGGADAGRCSCFCFDETHSWPLKDKPKTHQW